MTDDDLSRRRFFVIGIFRLIGVAMVMLGILIARGVIGWPAAAGYVLIAVGLADTFVMPQILARKWRTPLK